MYFPSRVRQLVIFDDGCTLWPDDELKVLAEQGDAIPVGRRDEFRIPQHHARSVDVAI